MKTPSEKCPNFVVQNRLSEGYQNGFNAGKSIFILKDERTVAVSHAIDNSIYGPRYLPVSPSLSQQMKDAVSAAVSEGIVSPPTQPQWDMILSDHPTTCVMAGAGSGKSTTLVLRVVFMHCYLNIPLNEITVISFTRASCCELREKIYSVLKFWRKDFKVEQIKGLVRTFHSALSVFGREILGNREWFDLLKSHDEKRPLDDIEIDNPLSSGRLSIAQKLLLNDAYIRLYHTNEEFRNNILSLMKLSIFSAQEESDTPKKNALKIAASRDLDLANKLNEIWFEKGLWPIDGVTPTPVECFRTKDGRIFYANGVIKKTGEPVFLTGGIDREYFFDKKEKFHYVGSFDKEESFPIISCISLRNKIMAWGCNKSSVFLDKTSKLEILKFISHDNNLEAPFFDVKLNGELTETNIVELLYQQASFIESMGIEVGCALSKMRKFKSKSVEYHFSNALSIFWPFFEGKISELGYITFNRAFLILSNPSFLSENNNKLNEKYKPLRHLLIDEFQDISPQIALWIKSVQLNISQLELEPSIMAIGDDWQSIYSWRGSSPEIFMNFSRFFPSHKKLNGCKEIYMMENFRSDEKIIRDAEYLMKRVKNKIDKKACSRRLPDGDETGVNFIDYATDDKAWIQDVILLINKQLELVSKQNRCDKNKVIVLSRTNSILNDVMNAGRFSSGVVFHTIHTAKGLQGEIAIILEDSRSLLGHTLRNRIYETVDFISSSYDDAMTDESLRLAYVAVTRGVKRVYWFAPSNSSGAYSQMKSDCM